MRKAEVIILTIIATFWLSAGFIVEQKIAQGSCKARIQKDILVPVPIGPNCYPTIMKRKCNEASDSFEINCFRKR